MNAGRRIDTPKPGEANDRQDDMPEPYEELDKILLIADADARDEALFGFVQRVAEASPEDAVKAARAIAELYKRGWALLTCVQALVKVDMERARCVAGIIEDEYNRLRARHTIEFTEARKRKEAGFDERWN